MAIRVVITLLSVLILAGSAYAASASQHFASRYLLQDSSSEVPPKCISAGTSLQSACSNELDTVLKSVGVQAPSSDSSGLSSAAQQVISQGKLDQALGAFNPSAGCCKAACGFIAELCACNQAVIDLAKGSLNVDDTTVNKFLSAYASKCGFKNLSKAAGTCPVPSTPTPAISC